MKWVGFLALIALSFPRPASAQTETRAAVAEALYRQARDLMAANKFDEACAKLAESQRLDPATGTLLNLAACHEKQGKLATAWIEYSDALAAARRDGREDRVDFARARAHELEPQLSKLTIAIAPDADLPDLVLDLDGANVGRAIVGAATPVDPGRHRVSVAAPGKKTRVFEIDVGPNGDQRSLTITGLQDEAAAATPAAVAPVAVVRTKAAPATAHDEDGAQRPIPTSVYVAGGVTAVLGVAALATGGIYLKKRSDYNADRDADQARDRYDTALGYGRVNVALWLGTAVAAGVTGVLYATRPTEKARAGTLHVTPWLGPELAGFGATGCF